MLSMVPPNCWCRRCLKREPRKRWAYYPDAPMCNRQVHAVDLATSLGETTACGRDLNDVPGQVTPHWQAVTCRQCLANQAFIQIFKVYPRPK